MGSRAAGLVAVTLALAAPSPAGAAPGDLDGSFGGDGVVERGSGENATLALSPDGRIVATAACGGDYSRFCVQRLLPDGSPDASFGDAGLTVTDLGFYRHSDAFGVALQGDGKVVAAGRTLTRDGGPQRTLVARYLADGRLDPSYGEGGLAIHDLGDGDGQEGIQAVAIQPDGKALLAGYVHHGAARFGIVARLLPSGALDPAFGGGGRVLVPLEALSGNLAAVALEPDGRILVAGADLDSGLVLRLLPDGAHDGSFGGGDGMARAGGGAVLRDVERQADGRIVAAGWAPSAGYGDDMYTVRLLPDGAPDPSFGAGGAVRTQLGSDMPGSDDPELITSGDSVALQSNGRVVVGGFTRRWHSLERGYVIPMVLVRLEPDGSPDASFGSGGHVLVPGTDAWNHASQATALQADGRIVGSGAARTVRLLGDAAPGGAPVPVPAPGPPPGGGDDGASGGSGDGGGGDAGGGEAGGDTGGGDASAGGPGADGGGASQQTAPAAARRVSLARLGALRVLSWTPATVRVAGRRALLPLGLACARAARAGCRATARVGWRAAGRGAADRRWRSLGGRAIVLRAGGERRLALSIRPADARRLRRAPALRLRVLVTAGSRRTSAILPARSGE